jgi:uncharacterized protein (TIGR01319 family)
MEIEILTIEVGSTITKANGFLRKPGGGLEHLAQGFAATSVASGDVGLGVDQAIADLQASSGLQVRTPDIFINSSAAGGLRMTVHGLTLSMTARAAREAALGAGAIVKLVTVGRLCDYELEEIQAIRPNIILLAGGVDFGEKEIVLRNAESLAALKQTCRCCTLVMQPYASQYENLQTAGIETCWQTTSSQTWMCST